MAVWRETTVGDRWHRQKCWWARVNGWRLEVHGDGQRWWFYADHKNGDDVFNSAWPEYRCAFKTLEAAQKAAERGATEGWGFLKPENRKKSVGQPPQQGE